MSNIADKHILVTRPKKQTKYLCEQIKGLGGYPVEMPLLKIKFLKPNNPDVLDSLADFDWMVFTSVNGVHAFFCLLDDMGISWEVLDKTNFAVVGLKTKNALQSYGFKSSVMPSIHNGLYLYEEFLNHYQQGETILYVRGKQSRREFMNGLDEKSLPFSTLTVYDTCINVDDTEKFQHILKKTHIDMYTFMSPSAIDAFFYLLKDYIKLDIPVICIGTTTGDYAAEKGFQHVLIPEKFTGEYMVEAIQNYFKERE